MGRGDRERSAGGRDKFLEGFRGGESAAVAQARKIIESVIAAKSYVYRHERPDVLQEVFTSLYQAFAQPGFRPPESFEAFIRHIAHCRCVDWVRARRAEREGHQKLAVDVVLPKVKTPQDDLARAERERIAKQLLGAVRRPCREILLAWSQGISYREISARDGRRPDALRQQVHQCLGEARKLLARLRESAQRSPERQQ